MATADEDEDETSRSSTVETLFDGQISCSPCDVDGKKLEAVGYCVNCEEYLCDTCFKYHRLPSVTRQHVMLDQEQIRKDEQLTRRIGKCSVHEERKIEFHCRTHSFLGCNVCFFHHQKSCKDSTYIADVCEAFANSESFKEFRDKVDCLVDKAEGIIEEAKRKPESTEKHFSDSVETIHEFKGRVFEEVERLATELIEKAESLKEAEVNKMRAVVDKCTTIQEAFQLVATESDALHISKRNFELYVHVVKSENNMTIKEDAISLADADTETKPHIFEGNEDLLQTLKNPWGLGNFIEPDVISRATSIADLSSDESSDENDSFNRVKESQVSFDWG